MGGVLLVDFISLLGKLRSLSGLVTCMVWNSYFHLHQRGGGDGGGGSIVMLGGLSVMPGVLMVMPGV